MFELVDRPFAIVLQSDFKKTFDPKIVKAEPPLFNVSLVL